jgi:hypothetical protein
MSSSQLHEQVASRLVQFSVVVAGTVHNPSILNPDFLQLRAIVPESWKWELASGSITTPPFAIVRFKNGVAITVEHEKMQVVDDVCSSPLESKAAQIARQYVTTLPHVHFTAVGINFQTAIQFGDPTHYLKERFLKEGAWDTSERAAQAVGLRFVYPEQSGRVVLSVDTGEAAESAEAKSRRVPVVFVNANFHLDTPGYPSDQAVVHALDHVEERWKRFTELTGDIIGVKWE